VKIIVRRKEFVEAVNLAYAVTPRKRHSKDALKWVQIDARTGSVTIGATDLRITVRRSIVNCDVVMVGSVLVECKPLLDIVRKVKCDALVIKADGHNLRIAGEGAVFSLPLQDAKEYPSLGLFDGEIGFQVNGMALQRMNRETLFAVTRESTRYAITGVLIEAASRTAKLIATDGRRLSVSTCRINRDIPAKAFTSTIAPLEMMALLAKVKLPTDSVVDVASWPVGTSGEARVIGLRAENLIVIANAVEGNFPPYADIIPNSNDKTATLPVDLLTDAIKAVSAACNEENKGVRFAFTGDCLTLMVVQDGAPVATAQVPIRYSGPAHDIGFNPSFVLDVLEALGVVESEIQFSWQDENRPGVFSAGDSSIHVVMPVTLAALGMTVAA
jgi:DNA polymerase-3 subunit beta